MVLVLKYPVQKIYYVFRCPQDEPEGRSSPVSIMESMERNSNLQQRVLRVTP